MTKVDIRYREYDKEIEYAKLPIENDIYKIITPVVKETTINGETVTERYVEFALHDETLNNIITKRMNKDELSHYVRLLQRLTREITSGTADGSTNTDTNGCK